MTVLWTVRAANDRGPQAESQVPSLAPKKNPNLFPVGNGLGFILYLSYDCFGNSVVKRKTSTSRKKP